MKLGITERNHYNPCFWTACWNSAHLNSMRAGVNVRCRPREQEIFYLSLKSDKILKGKTKNIFYEKRAGLADITKEDALSYCKRNFPDKFNELQSYYEQHPESLFLDF